MHRFSLIGIIRGMSNKNTTRPTAERPRSPAVVRAGEVYSLAELRRRLGWAEHAVRQARLAGLRLITFGRAKYVLGEDVLEFFKRLSDCQTGGGEAR